MEQKKLIILFIVLAVGISVGVYVGFDLVKAYQFQVRVEEYDKSMELFEKQEVLFEKYNDRVESCMWNDLVCRIKQMFEWSNEFKEFNIDHGITQADFQDAYINYLNEFKLTIENDIQKKFADFPDSLTEAVAQIREFESLEKGNERFLEYYENTSGKEQEFLLELVSIEFFSAWLDLEDFLLSRTKIS